MTWEVAVVSVPGHLSSPCHQSWAFQEGQKHWSGVEPLERRDGLLKEERLLRKSFRNAFNKVWERWLDWGHSFGEQSLQCRDPCNEEEPRQAQHF